MKHMSVSLYWITPLLCVLLLVGLAGCSAEKYRLEYDSKSAYSTAKDYYRAGAKVKLYYDLIATDTDYSFYLDGEPIPFTYDEKKGFIIEFIMPEHDVRLTCNQRSSMLPMDSY